jgi:serine/threonine-protein kinase
MAPEQALGKVHQQTTATDLYSLGAILYALLSGGPPFKGENVRETLLQVIDQAPPPLRTAHPDVPPALEAIARKCLEKDPKDRYRSADALAEDLTVYLSGGSVSALSKGSQWLKSLMADSRHTEVLARWGRVWVCHSAIVLGTVATSQAMLQLGVTQTWLHLLKSLPFLAGVFGAIWWFRLRKPFPLTHLERQLGLIWAVTGTSILLTGTMSALQERPPAQTLPFIALQLGTGLGVMAAMLGGSFYASTLLVYAAAFVVPVVGQWGPLAGGVLVSLALLVPGLRYARLPME